LGKIISGSVSSAYTVLKGHLQYNHWKSGDKIKFELYPYDYTGLYKALHLGNNPLYPAYNFEIEYPKDWTSLTTLVDKLNEKLNKPFSWPVWYPYLCLSGTATGMYVTGSLMKFFKNTGNCCLPTGELSFIDYNNRIDFISTRTLPGLPITGQKQEKKEGECSSEIKSSTSGKKPWFYKFDLDLVAGNRLDEYKVYSGYSYLIPTCFEFQGWKNNRWETLDSRCDTNLYDKITGLKPTCLKVGGADLLESTDGYLDYKDLSNLTGEGGQTSNTSIIDLSNTGFYRNLASFTQRKTVSSAGKCIGWNQDLTVGFIWPEGFPTGILTKDGKLSGVNNVYWCNPKEDEPEPPPSEPEPTGGDGIGNENPPVDLCQLRTGWNFTGQIGLNAINTVYDKYRVLVLNLSGQNLEGYKPIPEFYIGNVNLFSVTGGVALPVMTGYSDCIIGTDYTIDIEGITPFNITGQHFYSITPGMSGFYRTPPEGIEVTRPILDSERSIKFNKASGYVTSNNATGYYHAYLRPSGWACKTFDDYFFYNTYTNEISFEKTLCAYTTGYTGLSGTFDVIKQGVINRELLLGGFFNKIVDYVSLVSSGSYVGVISGVTYPEYEVIGYYTLTGKITGVTSSGKLSISDLITGRAVTTNNIYPYYPVATGFITDSGSIYIDFNKINNFDYFSINNYNFIYNDNGSLYSVPDYFNSLETLFTTIKGVSTPYGVIPKLNGNILNLTSVTQGLSGKLNVTTSNTGAVAILGFGSGKDIYPLLHKYYYVLNSDGIRSGIELTPIVSGRLLDTNLYGTGYYYAQSGTGLVTGLVNTFTGLRPFTGTWNLITGSLTDTYFSFVKNKYVSGINYYKNDQYNNFVKNIKLRVFYTNLLNTYSYEESDIADLIIKDLNNPDYSGDGFIIRITGKK
jgi:hypothetical protein